MAKNLVDGTNIIIEENADNINMNLSSTYTTNLTQQINDSFKENNVYSTTETVIGTWTNNKPLYRKIIEINGLPNNTSGTYATNIVNGSTKMFSAYGTLSSGDNVLSFPYVSPYSSSGNVAINVSNNASQINITTFTDRTSAEMTVIIEYTKTTD